MASNPSYGLRHEAGLNAGRVLPLESGRYAFGPEPKGLSDTMQSQPAVVTFELVVTGEGVTLNPGRAPVTIDGRPISRETRLHFGQMIEAGADRFTLEAHGRGLTPPPAPRRLVAPRLEPLPKKRKFRPRTSKQHTEEVSKRRKRQLARFSEEVEQTVRVEAMDRRSGTGSPVEARRAAEQRTPHALAGRAIFAVGLTRNPMPFSPEVEGATDGDVERVVRRYRQLSSVPYLIDFNHHRFGIVGPREASLAVGRHLLVANATAQVPLEVQLEIEPSRLSEWHVVAGLQPLGSPSNDLRVIDHPVTNRASIGEPPVALAIADSTAELPLDCSAILEIDDDGYATVTLGDDPPIAVIPIGISVEHAGEVAALLADAAPKTADAAMPAATPATDAQDLTTGAVLVTGSNRKTTTEVLSSLTVDLLQRPENATLAVHIIDAGDRSLIRLRQLDQIRQYATIDDVSSVEQLITSLEDVLVQAKEDKPAVLIANQIGPLVQFLSRMGRDDLGQRLSELVGSHDRVKLLVAVSGPTEAELPAALLPNFAVRLRCDDDQNGRLKNGSKGERTISISSLSGHDLTRSVAGLLSS